MKSFLMIIFLFFIFFSGKCQEKFYFDDSTGAIDYEGYKQWQWRYWNQKKLVAIKEYKNDSLTGIVKIFYPNSKVMFESNFENGKKVGETKKFDKKGCLIYVISYFNDTLDGEFTEFYSNGNVKKKLYFVKGKIDGKGIAFDKKGMIIAEGEFLNGLRHGTYKYKSKKGNYVIETYKIGQISDPMKTFSKDEDLLFEAFPDSTGKYYQKSVNKKNSKIIILNKNTGRSIYGDFLGIPFAKEKPPFIVIMKEEKQW